MKVEKTYVQLAEELRLADIKIRELIFENMELYLALKRVTPYLEVHGWTNVMPPNTDAERRLEV